MSAEIKPRLAVIYSTKKSMTGVRETLYLIQHRNIAVYIDKDDATSLFANAKAFMSGSTELFEFVQQTVENLNKPEFWQLLIDEPFALQSAKEDLARDMVDSERGDKSNE